MNEWISVEDEDNLPQGECIALGYQNEMLIGYISKNENEHNYTAENEYEILTHVTHYMIPRLPKPTKPSDL